MLALWQLGHNCVTALLTMLRYNSFQSSCANTNLYLNLIYQHAIDLKFFIEHSKQLVYINTTSVYYIAVIYVTYFQIYYYLVLCFH